jgi:hypothetical protein
MPLIPPTADAPLRAFAENASALITGTPTVYGLLASDATDLAALVSDFGTRLETSTTPSTRTRGTIAGKQTSKLALLAKLRQLIRIISAHPGVTNAQRADLGLNPRDVVPTPIPAPATRPLVTVDVDGTIRLVDETTPNRRGKPTGVRGAVVYTKIVPADDAGPAPLTPDEAKFAALATRPRVPLTLPAGSKNKTLWVLAQWYNERGELGPVSAPASSVIAA